MKIQQKKAVYKLIVNSDPSENGDMDDDYMEEGELMPSFSYNDLSKQTRNRMYQVASSQSIINSHLSSPRKN